MDGQELRGLQVKQIISCPETLAGYLPGCIGQSVADCFGQTLVGGQGSNRSDQRESKQYLRAQLVSHNLLKPF